MTSLGRLFQTRGVVAVKAQSPTVDSLVSGITRVSDDKDLGRPVDGMSATPCRSHDRFFGVVPCRQQ
jgi:hypothetical protein